jgi:hypothetical protein
MYFLFYTKKKGTKEKTCGYVLLLLRIVVLLWFCAIRNSPDAAKEKKCSACAFKGENKNIFNTCSAVYLEFCENFFAVIFYNDSTD